MEITFDTANNRLVVKYENGEMVIYTQSDKDKYIADTGRISDILAMGW